jgi:hypothetical protein
MRFARRNFESDGAAKSLFYGREMTRVNIYTGWNEIFKTLSRSLQCLIHVLSNMDAMFGKM